MRLYRGNDRRILKKMKKCFELIAARDTRADNPARTSALSTRTKVFPSTDAELTAAVAAVTAQVDAKLAATA